MAKIAALGMPNPLAIPAFLDLSTRKSPTRFHEDPFQVDASEQIRYPRRSRAGVCLLACRLRECPLATVGDLGFYASEYLISFGNAAATDEPAG